MADIEKDILLKVSSDTNDATKGFKSLKQELRDIEKEMNKMSEAGQEGSAQFQKMAQRAGELKDQIGDTKARINALASDTYKLDAMTQAIQGIAGGFAVAQGAMAVFGSENEDLEKAILKTQGAMALLQGVTEITNILQKESAFSSLFLSNAQKANAVSTEVATTATKGFSRALIATGIGAIVVAIGTLIAYWDDLKSAVESTSVSTKIASDTFEGIGGKFADAQVKVNSLIKDFQNYNTTTARRKEILKELEKISPNYFNKELKNINDLKKAQEAFNKALLQQAIIEASRKKITEITSENIEKMAEAQNKVNMTLDEYLQQSGFKNAYDNAKKNGGDLKRFLDSYSTYIAEKKKEVANLDKELQKQIAPFLKVSEQAEDQLKKLGGEAIPEPSTKEKPKTEKSAEDRKKELEKLRGYEAEYEEHLKKEREKNANEFTKRTEEEFNKSKDLSNGYYDTLITNAKVNNQSTLDLELEKLENLLQIQKDYGKSTLDVENQIALKKKEIADKTKEEQKKALEKGAEDYSQTYDEIKNILDTGLNDQIITQEQYNEAVKKLDQAQLQGKKDLTKGVADLFGALSDAVGKETKAGKALASAQALINTYLGISEVIKAKNPYPEPFGTAVKIANASVIALNGFKQVREINKVQIPNSGGGGGGSVPSGAGLTSAPSASAFGSQLPTGTQIQLDQFGDLKQNRSVKAYVVESEMTDMQGRSKRLKATSKIK